MKTLTHLLLLVISVGCATQKEPAKKKALSSIEFLTEACLGNDLDSCTALGLLHAAKNDLGAARELLTKACERKFALACKELGLLKEKISSNHVSSKMDLAKACHLGSSESCKRLKVITFNDRKVSELYEQFEAKCAEKEPTSCMALGNGMQAFRNYGEARKYFEKACDLNVLHGCRKQAQLEFSSYRFEKATALYKRLCQEKFLDACQDLELSLRKDSP